MTQFSDTCCMCHRGREKERFMFTHIQEITQGYPDAIYRMADIWKHSFNPNELILFKLWKFDPFPCQG